MSFAITDGFIPTVSNRMSVATGKIPYDSTFEQVRFRTYQPTTGSTTYQGVQSYSGQTVRFSVNIPTGSRFLLSKSFLRMTVTGACVVGGALGPFAAGESLHWNPLAAFSSAETSLSDGITLEKLDNNLPDATTIMLLASMSKEVLEASSNSLLTPCIESVVDTGLALSPESIARAAKFVSGGVIIPRELEVPLSWLYGCYSLPANITGSKIDISLTVRPPTDPGLTFKLAASVNVPCMVVNALQLNLCVADMTPSTQELERAKILSNQVMFRAATLFYDVKSFGYTPGATYVDSNIKNLQSIAYLFPAPSVQPGVCVSNLQYNSNLSSFQAKLGNSRSPDDAMAISAANRHLNSRIFTEYQRFCRRLEYSDTRFITTALSCDDMIRLDVGGAEVSPYCFLCAGWYDENAALHRDLSGSQLEVIGAGGVACADAKIVRVRVRFIEIRGNGDVYVLE